MVFDGIVIGLIVGFIRGGFLQGLRGLSQLKLKAGWVFPVLLLAQFLVYFLQGRMEWLTDYSGYFYMAVYVIGLLFLYLNWSQSGFKLIFAGVFLNFLVMALNGGVMPVSLEAAKVLGPYFTDLLQNNEVVYKHAMLMEDTRLPFLGDIIPLTPPYPRTQVISIGDIVMNVGIFMYLQSIMVSASRKGSKDALQESV
ncbi:DUF5317 domain-containing protein [Paenibacillus thermotolerans]|uniref:DUF5317 domain-containing protein n=1 Tax=Paenibacillus thermotolerans TaxID=3027807 RepID=UPI0023687345|nr:MULTISPECIES: DUF5317 domain-containing protein [unclassified Paenibacillus]